MLIYNEVELKEYFPVTHIIELLYRGLPKQHSKESKPSVDFWCLYYVERGQICFHTMDGNSVTVSTGEGVFFAPERGFRSLEILSERANLFTVFFRCPTLDKDAFHQKKHKFNTTERMILSSLITASHVHFERHSNLPNGPKGSKPKADAPPYLLHTVKASLEYLLLLIYQNKDKREKHEKTPAHQTSMLVNMATEYMYANLDKKLSVRKITTHVKMSESNFRATFKKHTKQSVMEYFHMLKIEQAKVMIRKNVYTQGEIATLLGYSSESYFCRHFKQKTGMTPSEYARLVFYG